MPTTYAIPDGRTVMAATTYTGTGSGTPSVSNAINGVSFQPDFVWIKTRNNGTNWHSLFNSVVGRAGGLASNVTNSEFTSTAGNDLVSFNAGGFSVGPVNQWDLNNASFNYVAWNWKAGGTAVSNTSGTITSSVSANTTAGFSVVTYTGNGTAGATVGHGLGVAPSMIISKVRSTTNNWSVYHASLGNAQTVYLNLTQAASSGSTTSWNSTTPTSSVFTIGPDGAVNASGGTFVAYCFSAVAGYSAFGSYTGNGSTDGPFVYLGFRPRFIMIKRTDSTGDWHIEDTSRDTYNSVIHDLAPNTSAAETSYTAGNGFDYLSNGFKLRDSGAGVNASGGTFIWAAFGENPFKFANAR